MLDSRKSIRCRTLLAGRLGIEKLPLWSLSCTIRNLSEGGACIAIERTALIPDVVELGISGGGLRRARLVWARDGQAGLAMVEDDTPAPVVTSGSRGMRTTDAGRLQARIDALTSKPPCSHRSGDRGFTRP